MKTFLLNMLNPNYSMKPNSVMLCFTHAVYRGLSSASGCHSTVVRALVAEVRGPEIDSQ